eukprot:2927015-Amphidinium_carterae.1
MGKQRYVRWEGGHLEQHARPLSANDPASGGLERVYPHPKPYPSISAEDYSRLPCSHYPGLLEQPKRIVYANEKGRYPFTCVPQLPDVDHNDPNSIEARRSMERRALYETIENKSWSTTRVLGRCLQNPDKYPWPEQMDLYEGCPNDDPRKGKCSRETWRWFWNRQSELICESPPVLEVSESGVWQCYVCKARPSPTVGLQSCLICKSVYMCAKHWIKLACLDNQAV